MRTHSLIYDDFFDEPKRARALIHAAEMRDRKYVDGVTYPNIALLPESVEFEIEEKLRRIFGPLFKKVISFARYSLADVTPPHWAHSDFNIAQFLAMIYLNEGREDHGTVTLRHRELGFERHPESEFEKSVLLGHANKHDEWEVTFTCPAKFNRLFILDAALVHAAMSGYGSTRESGRLVVSVFFNVG